MDTISTMCESTVHEILNGSIRMRTKYETILKTRTYANMHLADSE